MEKEDQSAIKDLANAANFCLIVTVAVMFNKLCSFVLVDSKQYFVFALYRTLCTLSQSKRVPRIAFRFSTPLGTQQINASHCLPFTHPLTLNCHLCSNTEVAGAQTSFARKTEGPAPARGLSAQRLWASEKPESPEGAQLGVQDKRGAL